MAMLWPASMVMHFVHAVGRRGRDLNPALRIMTLQVVSIVTFSPLSSGLKFQHHLISLRRRRGRLNV